MHNDVDYFIFAIDLGYWNLVSKCEDVFLSTQLRLRGPCASLGLYRSCDVC